MMGRVRAWLRKLLAGTPTRPPAGIAERPVAVVVPVYNGLEVLERLCRTLFDNTDPMHRIVFVDDASPDSRIAPYLDSLAASHPNVCILRNDVNKGFPFTANRGAAAAGGDFVLLNTDTEVPPGWIPRLFQPIWSDAGVASAMPLSNSWSSLKSAPGIVSIGEVERLGVAAIDKKVEGLSVPSGLDEWKTNLGFCLAVSGEAWRRVGPFDDEVFGSGYFEETDWCARARYRFGYRHVVACNVFVAHWHNGSFTSERKRELIAANREKMLSRNPEYARDNASRYALSRRAVLDAAYEALHGRPRPKVSVVVPVYNVENYLPRCLDSLLAQTLKGIEIICVDDGSTDNSAAILNEYAKKDSRITVVRQSNAGAGAARNAGLDRAAGEYLFFFDPDDSCEREMLETMYRKARRTKADVVVAGKKIVDAETGELIRDKPLPRRLAWLHRKSFPPTEIADILFSFAKAVPWDKLFRRAFVEANGLRFMALPRSNDVYFVNMALALAKRIALVRKGYYLYSHRRGGSLTFSKDRWPTATVEAYVEIERSLRARGMWDVFRDSFAEVFFRLVVAQLSSYHDEAAFGEFYRGARERLVAYSRFISLAPRSDMPSRQKTYAKMLLENEAPDALWTEIEKRRK